MAPRKKNPTNDHEYNAYEHGPALPYTIETMNRPVDSKRTPGRPCAGKIKFCTTLYPDTRADLMMYSQRMGLSASDFIEYLFTYYITTENAIEEAQIMAKRRNKDMPPHLRSGIKVHEPGYYLR